MSVVVVTVIKDDLCGLKRTEKSIVSQSQKVKWVIVTPSDQSDTFDYVSKLHDRKIVGEVISDLGGGIYAAMNLAINSLKAEEWVWFLNAGDEFAHPNSYETVNRVVAKTKHKWIYGGHFLGSDEGELLGEIKSPSSFKVSNQLFAKRYISHQAVIFKNVFLKSLGGFSTHLKIAADWDLMARAFKEDRGERLIESIAIFYMGGQSTTSRQTGNLELFKLRKKHLGVSYIPKSLVWFGFRLLRNIFVQSFESKSPKFANSVRRVRLGIKTTISNFFQKG